MIAIITYDTAHRKTQDIISQLFLRGYKDLFLIVLPFFERKNFKPLFKHRPQKAITISTDELCTNLGIQYAKLEVAEVPRFVDSNQFEHILIAGAGILPKELVLDNQIINSHPGYLPYSKGLDSFKWAILNGSPIGVTTHYVTDSADEGLLISQTKIAVKFNESFFELAQRLYELEIKMIVDAIEIINLKEAQLTNLADNKHQPTRRMSHHLELRMMKKFAQLQLESTLE